jgi:hypothetical protein
MWVRSGCIFLSSTLEAPKPHKIQFQCFMVWLLDEFQRPSQFDGHGPRPYCKVALNLRTQRSSSIVFLYTIGVVKVSFGVAVVCVQPGIDNKSREILTTECPRISINPIFSWRTYGIVPRGAQPGVVLDSLILEDIDPKAWAVVSSTRFQKTGSSSTDDTTDDGMSVAERFRLAFISRDERLAPKRAKNMRQNQRRAEKAWLSANPDVKANVWAGIAWKSLKNSTL